MSTNSFNIVFYHKDNLINNIRLKTIELFNVENSMEIIFNNKEVFNENLIVDNNEIINNKLIFQ